MTDNIVKTDQAAIIERVVISGDLSKLTPEQRVCYYRQVCSSLGLNPLTRPFDYIVLNGKLTLYARKDASEQLRRINKVSIEKPDIQFQEDWIIVTVAAHTTDGRTDSDIGVVNKNDKGDFGNALMKAVTKAKRRVTLSICGLGMLDETEVETIPDAKIIDESGGNGYKLPPPEPRTSTETDDLTADLMRPYKAEVLKSRMIARRDHYKGQKATPKQRQLLAMLLSEIFHGPDCDLQRHALQQYLWGHASLKEVDDEYVLVALNDWLKPTQDSGGEYLPDEIAVKEARMAYERAVILQGQTEMQLTEGAQSS